MKFLIATLLTALLSFIAGLYFPWWSLAIIAFLVAVLVHQKSGKAFLSAYTGVFFLWAGLAVWSTVKNEGLLAKKIATLLPLSGNIFFLVFITGTIAALVAGLGAMSGSFLRSTPRRK